MRKPVQITVEECRFRIGTGSQMCWLPPAAGVRRFIILSNLMWSPLDRGITQRLRMMYRIISFQSRRFPLAERNQHGCSPCIGLALLIQQHPDWAPAWIKSIIGLGAISEVWMDTGKTRRAGTGAGIGSSQCPEFDEGGYHRHAASAGIWTPVCLWRA